MTQPLVLSASSVGMYLRCGRQWMYRYVYGIKSKPSVKMARGIAIHKAVEVDMTQKMTTQVDLPVDDMLDAYSDSWGSIASDGLTQGPDDPPEGEMKDRGVGMVRLYHSEVAPHIQPVLVEQPVQFSINGQAYSGQIDLATRSKRSGKLIVRDTKSTSRTPAPNQYQLNQVGYALSQRQATNEIEADTVLDYLIDTKIPRYLPISNGGPASDAQVASFATIVGDVAGSINAGRFPPNGVVNGACRICGYRDRCPAALKE